MVSAHCCARRCCRRGFKKRAWWFWKHQGPMWRAWLFQTCSTTSTVWCKCLCKQTNCTLAVFISSIKLWRTILCHMAWPRDPGRRTWKVPHASSKHDPAYSSEDNSCTLKWLYCLYSSLFFPLLQRRFLSSVTKLKQLWKTGSTEAIDGCQGPACKQDVD